MTTYKITATIFRPGNTPCAWQRFSDKRLSKAECEKMMSIRKEAGVSAGEKVTLKYFKCVRARA